MYYQVIEKTEKGKRIALTNETKSLRKAKAMRDHYRERRSGRVYVKKCEV